MATALLIGVRECSLEQLKEIPCPPPEGRWKPVPHYDVTQTVLGAITDAGYQVDDLKLGVARSDARLFGTAILSTPLVEGVSLAVGWRSSFDRSISLQWCCGSRVTVCSNMAFRSEKIIARKHTTNGATRFHEAICNAVSELKDFQRMEGQRIRTMQERIIDNHLAESMLLKLYQDEQVLSPRTLPVALKEWRDPSFPVFAEKKNAWRLYNAVTWAIRGRAQANPQVHTAATITLGRVLEVETLPDPQNPLLPEG